MAHQTTLAVLYIIITTAMTTRALNVALITGSTRKSGPPTVLHPRVNAFIQNMLEKRGHNVTRIDPVEFSLLDKPYFGFASGKAPVNLQEIHSVLCAAHCYVCVTPEYNHSPSPGLLNILNHFGSSAFSFKPSAIGRCIYSGLLLFLYSNSCAVLLHEK
jgi:NAD(P)H-dependent FMN reductase